MNGPPNLNCLRQPAERTRTRRGSLGRKARLPKPRGTSEGSSSFPTRTTPSPLAETPIERDTAEALAQFLGALERQGAITITPEFRAFLFRDVPSKEAV